MPRRLVSSDEAVDTDRQHVRPCPDCPWSRKSLPGWLGGLTPEDWIRLAASDGRLRGIPRGRQSSP